MGNMVDMVDMMDMTIFQFGFPFSPGVLDSGIYPAFGFSGLF